MESNDVGGYLRTDGLGGPWGASVKLTQRCRENQEEDKEAGGSHGVGEKEGYTRRCSLPELPGQDDWPGRRRRRRRRANECRLPPLVLSQPLSGLRQVWSLLSRE